jgi:hypothetical protein
MDFASIPVRENTQKITEEWFNSLRQAGSDLTDDLAGALSYQGTWDADTNTPTLASGTGTKGHYYVVNVAGSTNLDGISDWQINDWAVYNGTAWEKIDNSDLVSSVNGQTGTVVLDTEDIAEGAGLGSKYTVKHNLTASVDPTVNDDIDLLYAVGSLWVNQSTNTTFSCTDNSDGAAVWIEVGGAGGVSDHNDLTNIQGGTTAEYYHLTAAELTDFQNSVDVEIPNATDWSTYVPTLTGFTSAAPVLNYRQDGSDVILQGRIDLNAAPTGTMTVGLPAGLQIKAGEIINFGTVAAQQSSVASGNHIGNVQYFSSTSVSFLGDDGSVVWNSTVPFTWASGDRIYFNNVRIPIQGWTATTSVGALVGTKFTTYAQAYGNLGQTITANVTDIPFATEEFDTDSAWSGTAYTIPRDGVYKFSGGTFTDVAGIATPRIAIDGVAGEYIAQATVSSVFKTFHYEEKFTAGQVVSIRFGDLSADLANNSTLHYIRIRQVQ